MAAISQPTGGRRKTVSMHSAKPVPDRPRARNGPGDRMLIANHQRRCRAVDRKIIGIDAGGLTAGGIERHIEDIHGVEASPRLGCAITDAVMEEVAAWQNRPLEPCSPSVGLDAMRLDSGSDGAVSNQAVPPEGTPDVLDPWLPANEGATFPPNQGVADIPIAVVNGRKGCPQALAAAFAQTRSQSAIVHRPRQSITCASDTDRKAAATAGKTIPTAVDAAKAEAASAKSEDGDLATRSPAIAPNGQRAGNQGIPFLDHPPKGRRPIHTTNAIAAPNSTSRRTVPTRGHCPSHHAAATSIPLAVNATPSGWKHPGG